MIANRRRAAVSDASDFAVPAAADYHGDAIDREWAAMDRERAAMPCQQESRSDGAAFQFLNTLFGAKPAELFLLVWLLAAKTSRWFRDITEAADYVQKFQQTDVYVGVALSPADYGHHNRCKADETAGIVGLWIDLDYQSPAHKKKNLPPTMQDALELMPPEMPPSIVVHSGHGLQAWWIFPKPWIFADAEDRQAAAALANDWKLLFKQRAAARGSDVDSVSDLARIMRIPGTTNTKVSGDFRAVEVIEMNDRRYKPQEIRAHLDRELAPVVSIAPLRTVSVPPLPIIDESLVLDSAADPPFRKFDMLCEIDSRFRASWDNKRLDMQDQSASAFDLSLANFAAQAWWSDQEIANLLIAHRRKHGHDLKLRPDYFHRTIQQARAAADRYWKEQAADEVLKSLMEGAAGTSAGVNDPAGQVSTEAADSEQGKQADSAALKATIIDTLATKFRVPIKRIVKFTGDEPQYRLETELGCVQLGAVPGLIYQNRLRCSIASATGRYLPHFSEKVWPGIAALLLKACEEVDRGQDATLAGTLGEFLRAYLDHKRPHASIEEADAGREPFLHNGAVYLFSGDFKRWLSLRFGEKIIQNQLTTELRTFGAAPESFNLTVNGKATTRSAWRLPAGTWESAPEQEAGLALL
jgi:hypothetical protein